MLVSVAARSLHRLRAVFLLSLKYLPFTGVKCFLILVTDGIRGRLPFRALKSPLPKGRAFFGGEAGKSPLPFSHLKVGVWHAMEGVGGGCRLYSPPCTSFSTLFSGSSSHFAPCRNCFTRLPAVSVERSGVNTTCMPVMLSLVVNALAERAPFEVMPILNEAKPSS